MNATSDISSHGVGQCGLLRRECWRCRRWAAHLGFDIGLHAFLGLLSLSGRRWLQVEPQGVPHLLKLRPTRKRSFIDTLLEDVAEICIARHLGRLLVTGAVSAANRFGIAAQEVPDLLV